ncbi:DUF1648 domain-containing protein [Nonomuraea sp. SBT364]|uniref:DUF1648 domain-containing protein n=1 Tax=Nonomuraea sp. SBT364 TaxID=1580530 RepID=UPI00066A9432|nr:hypothetical protein [Nonomuraea sp. SBT364]
MIALITVALITCLTLALPVLARPTLPFGVRVPAERAGDPVIVAERRRYARAVVAVAVLSVPVLFLAGWPEAVCAAVAVVDLLLYGLAHHRIRAAGQAGAWAAGRRRGVAVDTTFRTDPVRVPWRWAVPALVVVLVTAGVGWFGGVTAFEPVLHQVAITLVVPVVALIVLRARPDLDAARPRGSARRYRVYLRGVAAMTLLSAACLNLGLFVAALRLWRFVPDSAFWQVVTYLPLAGLLAGWVIWETRVGQAGHRLPALPGEEQEDSGVGQRDDNRHWFLAGTVYVNRRDPALLVHARAASSSWTLNLGHPVAWVLLAVLAGIGLLALSGVIDLPEKRGFL